MCVKEVQRIRPVVIMSFPHHLTKDETYNGYLLPKGTTLIGNTWGLHHDPERFPNPDEFDPERYRDHPLSAPEYAAMADENARDHWGYGYVSVSRCRTMSQRSWLTWLTCTFDAKSFGRRVCVGLHIAERSMFINIARLAWAFNITEDPAAPVDFSECLSQLASSLGRWSAKG